MVDNMISAEVQQIEQNIKQAQKLVDVGESLERLSVNRDFKKVVLEGYFEQEAIRLVHLLSDPSMQSYESQSSINLQMNSIGSFKQYLTVLKYKASMADKSIAADEQMRDELLAEDMN